MRIWKYNCITCVCLFVLIGILPVKGQTGRTGQIDIFCGAELNYRDIFHKEGIRVPDQSDTGNKVVYGKRMAGRRTNLYTCL